MAELCFICKFCQGRIFAEEEAVGVVGNCPHCDKPLLIPPPAGEIACPGCAVSIKYSDELIGDNFSCPSCKTRVYVAVTAGGGTFARAATVSSKPAVSRGVVHPRLQMKKGWFLLNCLTNESVPLDKFPFEIGSANAVDLNLDGTQQSHCSLYAAAKDSVSLTKSDSAAELSINGNAAEETTVLESNTDYAVTIGPHCFVIRNGRDLDDWKASIDLGHWVLTDAVEQRQMGPVPIDDLANFIAQRLVNRHQTLAAPQGLNSAAGFPADQVAAAIAFQLNLKATKAADGEITGVYGHLADNEILCPVCWLRFAKGDAMHIAVHDDLRGDPILGEDAPLRFHATRFNDTGQALDAMGMTCLDVACPHCRRKLPTEFLQTPHHIFSIVGAPSSGKSYYLSVLAKVLPRTLFNQYGVVFKDSDPTGNANLTTMKNRLFTGSTPEQLYLDKTNLEGAMYEKILRHGREVSLPKPFIFSVAAKGDGGTNCGLIFYDNAGEHFEPGIDEANSPGAQHVAAAASVFFLFDPTANIEFRQKLAGHHDPQLQHSDRLDQQDIILAEMAVRIKRLLHLAGGRKIASPLVMLIGKSDVWLHLIGAECLKSPLRPTGLDLRIVAANSRLIRDFVQSLCPEIVANAESLAQKVVFFPVSSFGHSPLKLPDGRIAPDPNKLNPQGVDTPMIWALSQIMPGLIPVLGQ